MTVKVKGRTKTKKKGRIEKKGKGKHENKWFLEQMINKLIREENFKNGVGVHEGQVYILVFHLCFL